MLILLFDGNIRFQCPSITPKSNLTSMTRSSAYNIKGHKSDAYQPNMSEMLANNTRSMIVKISKEVRFTETLYQMFYMGGFKAWIISEK